MDAIDIGRITDVVCTVLASTTRVSIVHTTSTCLLTLLC